MKRGGAGSRSAKAPAPFPSREQLLDFIREGGARVSKREIARAFHLDAEQRVELKRLLRDLAEEGKIARGRGRRLAEPGTLPSVAVIEITHIDTDGETAARPVNWPDTLPPRILVAPERRSRNALGPGDRVLARLKRLDDNRYEAQVLSRLQAAPPRTLGVYEIIAGQGRILSIDRRSKEDVIVPPGASLDAEPGELVWAEVRSVRALGLKQGRIVERLGPTEGPRSITPITIHDHEIPVKFTAEALAEAAAAGPAALGGRDDLRPLPLVTIDGEDARDFDDAVFAEADDDPGNVGGWHLIVAIADVAHYVRPGSPLDKAAMERGNSVYFPDRVVPMLPEALSNGWCSLKPDEDRPCLAAHLWIDGEGRLRRHHFTRAMMRSAARLTYGEVQAAADGRAPAIAPAMAERVIAPLFGAYRALAMARAARGVLELDVPERKVIIGADGRLAGVAVRERYDSHKLIEEFMILANVAAAEALESRRTPCMYRVHDQPTLDKLTALREFLESLGIALPKAGTLKPKDFNRVLAKVEGRPEARLVNDVVLRSQAQACYDPANIGHFGLALTRYCHFTSPIRRYADLLVHRALITALKLGEGGLGAQALDFARLGEHISATERRAAAAERDAVDRFTAAFLAERVGSTFTGRISGVTRFGLFVTLEDTGADGLVPISTLPKDYYRHDEAAHRLIGEATGLTFRLGDEVEVRLLEANPLTGGIIFEMLNGVPAAGTRRRGRMPRRVETPVRRPFRR
jgi:ribonuclease R